MVLITFLFRIVKKNKHCNWVVFQISTLRVFLKRVLTKNKKVFQVSVLRYIIMYQQVPVLLQYFRRHIDGKYRTQCDSTTVAPLYGANYTFLFRIVKKNKYCDWVVFQISTLRVFFKRGLTKNKKVFQVSVSRYIIMQQQVPVLLQYSPLSHRRQISDAMRQQYMAPLYGANYTFLFRIVKKNKHRDQVVFQISTLRVFFKRVLTKNKKVFQVPVSRYYNVVVGPRFTSIFTAVTSTANIGRNAIVLLWPHFMVLITLFYLEQ